MGTRNAEICDEARITAMTIGPICRRPTDNGVLTHKIDAARDLAVEKGGHSTRPARAMARIRAARELGRGAVT